MAWVVPIAMGAAALYKMYQDNQNNDKIAQAGQQKLQNVGSAVNILNNYRQTQRQQGLNALNNQMGAYQGASNVLASMYGPMGSIAPNTNLDKGGPMMGRPPPTPIPQNVGSYGPAQQMGAGGMGAAQGAISRLPPMTPAPPPGTTGAPIAQGVPARVPPGAGALPGGLANLAGLFRGRGP